MEHSPWVEKYRPTEFDEIVLDATNKKILTNVIDKKYFPNLLFYGPPGTGKTEIAKIMGKIFSQLGVLKKEPFTKSITEESSGAKRAIAPHLKKSP